jgi:succinate dehydrogenase / fumarate reductase cytochrome b subunit
MAMAKLVATRRESPPSPTFATNRLAIFWHTAVGKKVVMAVTGIVLVAFVIVHMLGNLKI